MGFDCGRTRRRADAHGRMPGSEAPLRGLRGRIARRREEERRVRARRIALIAGAAGLVIAGLAALLLLGRSRGTNGHAREPNDSKAARGDLIVPMPQSYMHTDVAHQVARLRSPDLRWRVEAANTLATMGPRAYEAVPALLNAMARKSCEIEFSQAADKALKAIGASALPALADALRSNAPQARFHAASALAKLGPAAAPAVNLLAEVLESDPDYSVRSCAADALGAIGPAASPALPALRRAAGNPSEKLTGDTERAQLRVRARMAMLKIRGGTGN
ncbi:MAG: HEAT repeat domain-containing protein [Planctomycetes bacterium]|nr:HEAT repeat domain-containing protein [Planctomycetota bacterium]